MNEQTKQATRNARLASIAALSAGLVAACGGGSVAADAAPQASAPSSAAALGKSNSGTARLVAQPKNTEGRLLASNCFQCHGTLGTGGFDAIRGKDVQEVLEFMRKPASSSIMSAHAQGYTPAQLQLIINYLQQ
ncbi:MAG: c-type cytochrome [Burkholderiales bacterium]